MYRICLSILLLISSVAGICQTDYLKAEKYYFKAMDKVSRKDFPGAIADFSEALKIDTGFIEAYENRGVTKYYLKDYEGAIADYDKALEINPEDGHTYIRRGWAKFDLKEYEDAITDFTKAIDTGTDDPVYYNTRGEAKYRMHDYQGAISDFDLVIDAWYSGRDAKKNAYFWRGLVKIDMGQKESGCLDLQKAVRLGNKKAAEVKQVYCE
jgi:tetratricopeptide (TPR) repeat protein